MLSIIGISTISVLLVILVLTSTVFFWLSDNIAYNPCTYNVYKDDYSHFIIIGLFHSFGVAIFTILQLLAEHFPLTIKQHLFGSIQILSAIPTIVYYHFLVIVYKFRYLQVRNLGHIDYRSVYCLEFVCICTHTLIFFYSLFLFQAELNYPLGMYSADRLFIDPVTGWTLEIYENSATVVMGLGILLVMADFYRITRSSYRTNKIFYEFEGTTQFYFRKYVSHDIEPHYVNDLVTLFAPTTYLLVRGSPVMQLNGLDVFAKCLLITHPLVFVIIYMLQIKLATRNSDKTEMECRCCVCRKKSMSARNDSRLIRLKVMGSGVRGADSGERGGAATRDGQPTETTPSTQMEVIEEL